MPCNQSTQATKKHHLNKYPYDLFMTVPVTQANNHVLYFLGLFLLIFLSAHLACKVKHGIDKGYLDH
jgi:hypothetical protein